MKEENIRIKGRVNAEINHSSIESISRTNLNQICNLNLYENKKPISLILKNSLFLNF